MKKLITIILLLVTASLAAQTNQYTVRGRYWVKTDSLLIVNGDTIYIDDSPSNGQFLRRVDGWWINQDFTGTGTDSLRFDAVDGELVDYRGGSAYDIIPVKYENIFLEPGATRTISVSLADGGQPANDLLIKAGDNDDNIGGADLYLRGGGTFDEHGDVYLGSVDYNSNIYVEDTLQMDGNRIKGLPAAIDDSEPVILSQITGLTQNVYSIALPYATTVQGRVSAASEGTDYETGWVLAAGTNTIDLQVTHGLGRRVAEVNVMTVSGTTEALLRPFAGAYSGWQTTSTNVLLINGLATTPLPLKIYIVFK
jgi:hypothetical protein